MIEINNLTNSLVDKAFFKKVTKKILAKERKRKKLSIALVGPDRMKELNKRYLKKNRITDVLSFSYDDAGEIVVCPQQVKKNAGKYNSTFKYELTRVLIHGILHLLGENHEISKKKAKKMEQKQKYYLNLFLK